MQVFILCLGEYYDTVDRMLAFDSSEKAKEWCKEELKLSVSKWTGNEDYYSYEGAQVQDSGVMWYSDISIYRLDVL